MTAQALDLAALAMAGQVLAAAPDLAALRIPLARHPPGPVPRDTSVRKSRTRRGSWCRKSQLFRKEADTAVAAFRPRAENAHLRFGLNDGMIGAVSKTKGLGVDVQAHR